MHSYDVMSSYLMGKLINHIFRNIPYTPPAQLFLGLYKYNNYGQLEELSGNGYSRIPCPTWVVLDTASAYNSEPLISSQATLDWGTIVYSALFDSATGGNILFGGFTNQLYVYTGEKIKISTSNIQIHFKSKNMVGGWCEETVYYIMDFILNNGSFTSPGTSLYMALGRNAILRGGTYNMMTFTEIPFLMGYSRIRVGGSTIWDAPVNGVSRNTDTITITNGASLPWGSIDTIVFFNSSSAGDKIMWTKLYETVNPSPGDGLKIKPGELLMRFGPIYLDPIQPMYD